MVQQAMSNVQYAQWQLQNLRVQESLISQIKEIRLDRNLSLKTGQQLCKNKYHQSQIRLL